jgi:hypothetical protein
MLVNGEEQEVLLCPICGEQFIPANSKQIYCGKTCANRASELALDDGYVPPKRKCHTCGVPTYDFECNKCRAKRKAKGEWF